MATYVRQSSFSDGDTITSALFNNEFNQLVNAFNASSGHTHDGSTAGDGGPISNLFSNSLVFGTNANIDVAITFNATTNDGVLTWMEDEDYFKFSDDLLIDSTEKVQFRDTGLYIYSSADGQLDIVADTEVQIAATTIDINGNADISGNLGIGGNLTVTGTTTFNGGTLTLGDSAADNVVFGADVDSNIIPDDDGAYDLGSSTQEWRDLYIDGTAHIDTLDVDVNATIAGTLGVTGVLTGTSLDISGDIDVDGTTNLDVVDIDGAVDMATTLAVAGNVDFNGDLDVDGTTNLDVVDIDGAVDMATTLAVAGNVDFNGDLDVDGTTNLDVVDIDGAVNMATTLLVTGNVDFNGDLDVDGTTNLDVVDIDGAVDMATTLTVGGEITAASLDISGNVDIDGTLETDALSLNGTTVTASAADINLIDGITNGTVIASKAIVTDANIDITGGRNITISGELDAATLDISGNADIDGTLEADAITVNGTALASVIAGTTVNTATVATTVTITDNENTNENNAIVFTAGGDLDGGNLGLESDGDLKYNPSTGTLSATNISVSGTLSTVDSVTMSANNAVVFEGATADAHETTLTVVDATADRTITLPNVSGTVPVLAAASNTQITSTPEELNALDGITAVVGELNALDIGSTAVGTAVASKAVILDSNKDYTGIRNLTISGELDAATLDISGDIDVDGTTNLDVVDIDGPTNISGAVTITAALVANGGVVFNEGSDNVDFRVESNALTHGLFLDASTNILHLGGSTQATSTSFLNCGGVTFSNGNAPTGHFFSWDNEGAEAAQALTAYYYDGAYRDRMSIGGNTGVTSFNNSGVDIDFRIQSADNGNMFFVDAASNEIGIGTNSPDAILHVLKGSAGSVTALSDSTLVLENSTHNYLTFLSPNDKEQAIIFGDADNNNNASVGYNHNTDNLSISSVDDVIFNTSGATRGRFKDAGLDVTGVINATTDITAHSGQFVVKTDGGGSYLGKEDNSSLRIITNNATRLTIANNGVSTFSSSVAIGGGASAGTPTLDFYHNDSLRGFIRATDAAGLLIDSDSALTFNTNNTARWAIGSSGHITPNNQHSFDIGGVNAEVRNIYAQGLYVGGSAAANKLDDYEEGTWTPTSDVNLTINTTCRYTKIGNHITYTFDVTFASQSDGNSARLQSLPYDLTTYNSGFCGWQNTGVVVKLHCHGDDVNIYNGTSNVIMSYASLSTDRLIGTITGIVS